MLLRIIFIVSSYKPQEEGIFIAYTSVYGNTRKVIKELEKVLIKLDYNKVEICDLSRHDISKSIENAFRYSKLILSTTTYIVYIFPAMKGYMLKLVERK